MWEKRSTVKSKGTSLRKEVGEERKEQVVRVKGREDGLEQPACYDKAEITYFQLHLHSHNSPSFRGYLRKLRAQAGVIKNLDIL